MTKAKFNKFLDQNNNSPNQFVREKTERYKKMRNIFYGLNESLEVDGPILRVQNGKQVFTKLNPAVSEIQKVNIQLSQMEDELYSSMQTSQNIARDSRPNSPPPNSKGGLV